MSIAALADAIDTFATNDLTLRDMIIAQLDTELAEIEAERSQINAALNARRERIADRKVAITNEFDNRAVDINIILNGKSENA